MKPAQAEIDRKSTRLNSSPQSNLVCRLLLEKKNVDAGTSKLVGTDRADIVREATRLLEDPAAYEAMSHAANPYGDCLSCACIADAMLHWAGRGARPNDFEV